MRKKVRSARNYHQTSTMPSLASEHLSTGKDERETLKDAVDREQPYYTKTRSAMRLAQHARRELKKGGSDQRRKCESKE